MEHFDRFGLVREMCTHGPSSSVSAWTGLLQSRELNNAHLERTELFAVYGKAAKAGRSRQSQTYTPLFEHWCGARNLAAFASFYETFSEETAAALASRLELDRSDLRTESGYGEDRIRPISFVSSLRKTYHLFFSPYRKTCVAAAPQSPMRGTVRHPPH